eukprot:TRINITY_DN8828_c0_g1_i2.p1 TRINITY_DN8828_c0_g1~~TRINITY_DN8828_c0_g1_i2.p1  ORF type:complete len:465 (+),score=47.09 TRINITY_DN8828_c0_g1_i2:59-1453(+)
MATLTDDGATEKSSLPSFSTAGCTIVGLATGGPVGAIAALATSSSAVYLTSESFTVAGIAGVACICLVTGGGFAALVGVSGLAGITTTAVSSYLTSDYDSEDGDELREEKGLCDAQDVVSSSNIASDDRACDVQQQQQQQPFSKQVNDDSEASCSALHVPMAQRQRTTCCCIEGLFTSFRKRFVRDVEPSPTLVSQTGCIIHSRAAFLSHFERARTASGRPLLLYDTSTSISRGGVSAHQARCVSFDGTGEELIENDYFKGRLVFMHRPTREGASCRHEEYFATHTRRWEIRLQGTFKQKPKGKLFAGVVLRDYDYTEHLGFFARWISSLSYAPLEHVIGAKIHFTLGDRAEAAGQPDAEVAHVVGGLEVFDQVIVTPGGPRNDEHRLPGLEQVPPICGNLDALGVTRNGAGSSSNWSSTVRHTSCCTSSRGAASLPRMCSIRTAMRVLMSSMKSRGKNMSWTS